MSRRQQPVEVREVLYILDPPKPPTNGWGTTGFVFSILGILSFGLLSPLGLLFSFFGLWKRPRTFAVLGFLLSLLGVGFIGSVVSVPVLARHHHREMQRTRQQIRETERLLDTVTDRVNDSARSQQTLLDGFAGNEITIGYQDTWGTDLRFDEREDGFAIRSAGPDRRFDSRDDIVQIEPWGQNLVRAVTREESSDNDEDHP